MVYEQFILLCERDGIKPTRVLAEFGLSKGNLFKWRNGNYPSVEVLIKLADYFGSSTDYLLGRTDNPEINR